MTILCQVYPNLKEAYEALKEEFALVGKEQLLESSRETFINRDALFVIHFYNEQNIRCSLEVDKEKYNELVLKFEGDSLS